MPLGPEALQAIWLTLQLATLTTLVLLLIATPLAWWLSQTESWWKGPVGAFVTLPLVLPPSVLGFYLLVAMGPAGPLGQFTQAMGWGLLSFTFTGLVIGSVVFSMPFAVQPLQHAFESMGRRPMEVAATLRASPVDAFFTVALPQARTGLLTAAILSFAHTVGEFGVVLMIGGNIPGKTRVVSTQIYGHVEAMEYAQAHWLAGGMVLFSFVVLLCLALLKNRSLRIRLTLPRADFELAVDLHLPGSGITVLFGASGSGKTSVLRCVAGLERAHPGLVVVAGEVWQDDATQVFLPTHQRALGYVFQEASLFAHLDVLGNLRYGLKRARSAQAEATLQTAAGPVDQVLSSVHLPMVLGDDAGALLRGQVLERDTAWHLARVGFAGGAMWLRDSGLPVGQAVRLRVLARDVSLTVQEPMQTSIQNHLPCVIDSVAPDAHPSQALVRLRCGESFLLARVTHRSLHALGVVPGSAVWAQVKSVAIVP
eukprot:gene6719-6792_t